MKRVKHVSKGLRDAARLLRGEVDEGKVQERATDEFVVRGSNHFVFNRESSATLKTQDPLDEESVIGSGLTFVVDRGMVENGPDFPSLEICEFDSSLTQIVVSGSFAILQIDRVIDMSERVQFVAADDSFRYQ